MFHGHSATTLDYIKDRPIRSQSDIEEGLLTVEHCTRKEMGIVSEQRDPICGIHPEFIHR